MTDTLSDVLTMTGCKDRAELEDMANIGRSFMTAMESVITQPGPFHGWAPAEDPAEIVTDLVNALDEATWADTAVLVPPRSGQPAAPVLDALSLAATPWALHTVWSVLRASGMAIPTKAEAEIAVSLHYLVGFAIRHGETWRDEANKALAALAAKITPPAEVAAHG